MKVTEAKKVNVKRLQYETASSAIDAMYSTIVKINFKGL
jgi:hypothetical protein